MLTITRHAYTIEEHPQPEKVYEWIRGHWHDLMELTQEELLLSLKALAEATGTNLDYCFGAVPDRGEYIHLNGTCDTKALDQLVVKGKEDYPLTGCYWDAVVIEAAQSAQGERSKRLDITTDTLKVLHAETDYQYSDEALREHCIGNDYHFYKSGKFHVQ